MYMATTHVATRKRRAWNTTVFVKQLMAISGFLFVAFLVFHAYGNLKIFSGAQTFDHYAQWLHGPAFAPILPPGGLLWIVRVVMILALVVHVWAAAYVTAKSRRARGSRYVVKKSATESYAAHTMAVSGVLIFLLLVFHILNFTTLTFKTGFSADATPYGRLVGTFQNPWLVLVYLLFVGAVALHVGHGFWSAFQTFGWIRKNTRTFMVVLSGIIGAALFVMFMATPTAIVTGLIS